MNKLTEKNPKVGLTIKWQMSKWKTADRIETHHSNWQSSRTIVFWCYWLTTNDITTLLTNQGQRLTIYNSLWWSVTFINSPFHDYTFLFIYWWLWSTWLLHWGQTIIDDICEGIRVPESVKCLLVESGILGFGMRNKAQRIRNPTKDWNPIQRSTRKNWNLVPGIRNPRRGIQNPRLSWIPLHETKSSTCQKLLFTYLLNATSFHQS